jgi:DNA repair exonuclease SbcCD nuclease subunit
MKTLILGDCHIGRSLTIGKPGIGSALNSRIVDQINILDWTLKIAIDYDVSNIICTGDIFQDAKPHPTIIALFVAWVKRCIDNDISLHIIAGNHDILRSGQYYMSALDIISEFDTDDVYIYKQVSTLHTNGASFTLFPFRDRRSFQTDSNDAAIKLLSTKIPYEVSSIDRSNAKILIGHLAIEGSIFVGDEVDDMGNELFCPVSMFNQYDYVWMGHVHKPQVLSKSPYVSHIGSMDISDFGETDHKKVIVLFDPDASTPYKYLEIPTRPLKQVSISVPDNITNTTQYVVDEIRKQDSLTKAIVKVGITLNSPDLASVDKLVINKSVMDMGAFHIARITEEKKVAAIKTLSINENIDNTVNEQTAIKMYAKSNIDEQIRNDFISLAMDIVAESKE